MPKTYVSIDEDLAEKLKESEDIDKQKIEIDAYIERMKTSIKAEFDHNVKDISDKALLFKAELLKARMEYAQVLDDSLTELYTTWEKAEPGFNRLIKKVREVKKEVEPLREELKEANKLLEQVPTYHIERLIGLMEKVEALSCSDRETLKLILEHKK